MKKNFETLKRGVSLAFTGLVLAGLASCGKEDENSPGFEFMPDMYRSPSVEYYGVNTIDGDTLMAAMTPVKGTIARGFIPYAIPNTTEGYEASVSLTNPLDAAQRGQWEKDGEVLYKKFCIHCHGAKGDGDGKVGGKLPGAPPSYSQQLKDLPAGKIYHSITYGKGLMGPHNSLVNEEERWKLVYYVQKLQGKGGTAAGSDSTAVKGAAAGTGTTSAGAAPTGTANIKDNGKKA